jgi:hypothetical protein
MFCRELYGSIEWQGRTILHFSYILLLTPRNVYVLIYCSYIYTKIIIVKVGYYNTFFYFEGRRNLNQVLQYYQREEMLL